MNELIPLFKVFMSDEAVERVSHTLRSGFIGQGIVVDEFEKKLKNFFNSNFLVSTNSATSAEHLIFHILKKPLNHNEICINHRF